MDPELFGALLKVFAFIVAGILIWVGHHFYERLLPSNINLHFRREDGRPISGARVANGRGGFRVTDDVGGIRNAPRAWAKHGTKLIVYIDGQLVEVQVQCDNSGEPEPIVVRSEVSRSR